MCGALEGQALVDAYHAMDALAFASKSETQGMVLIEAMAAGAPVVAFVRVSGEQIRLREKIYKPNVVLVLDPSLLDIVDVAEGLAEDGVVVVNTTRSAEELKQKYGWPRVATVDAQKVALEELGVPITNTTMLGALLRAVDILPAEAMEDSIAERFGPKLGPKNYKALGRAHAETVVA